MKVFLNYKGKANLHLVKRLVGEQEPGLFAIYKKRCKDYDAGRRADRKYPDPNDFKLREQEFERLRNTPSS